VLVVKHAFGECNGNLLDDIDKKHDIIEVDIVAEVTKRVDAQQEKTNLNLVSMSIRNIGGIKVRDEELRSIGENQA
jgi:hypothetical protein